MAGQATECSEWDCRDWLALADTLVDQDTIYQFWVPIAVAVITVLVAIQVNHLVRLSRLKRLYAFSLSFAPDPTSPESKSSDIRLAHRRDIRRTPSHEFAISKYLIDLDEGLRQEDFAELKRLIWSNEEKDNLSAKLEYLVNGLRCFALPANRRLVFAALPLMVLLAVGTVLAIDTARTLDIFATGKGPTPTFASCSLYPPALSIAVIGAYLGAMATLARSVALFDLSGVAFLRAALQIVANVAIAVLVWNLAKSLGLDVCSSPAQGFIFPVIFLVGLLPDIGLSYLIASLANRDERTAPVIAGAKSAGGAASFGGGLTRFIKQSDSRFAEVTRSTPLDVIDGIDIFTRFRLAEAGVYEVQNLAVANPILLHIETPYGIYQTIDWVAQAQLCTVVGPERFQILRQHNIRTIFDLERAVLSLKSTSAFRRWVGAILLMTTETSRQIERITQSRFPDMRTPPAEAQPGAAVSSPPESSARTGLTIDEFDRWLVEESGKPATFRVKIQEDPVPPALRPSQGYHVWPKSSPAGFIDVAKVDIQVESETASYVILEGTDADATIKHMVRVIMDDLHVIRLRQIWEIISRRLGGDAATLDDSEDTIFGG